MALPELNTDMIYDLIKWAEADQKGENDSLFKTWGKWDQGLWANGPKKSKKVGAQEIKETNLCGTAFCMAGQAVAQSDYRMILESGEGDSWGATYCVRVEPTGKVTGKGVPLYRDVPGARAERISQVARKVLGLASDEVDFFFEGTNSLYTLKAVANGMCARRGLDVMFPDVDTYGF